MMMGMVEAQTEEKKHGAVEQNENPPDRTDNKGLDSNNGENGVEEDRNNEKKSGLNMADLT